jgi:hypothetical protein
MGREKRREREREERFVGRKEKKLGYLSKGEMWRVELQ